MDLLSLLKQANIFSPQGQTPQQFPVGSIGGPDISQMPQQQQAPDINAMIQNLLTPQTQQFQNYQQMIQQMPQEQDYQPNLLRRIGATLAGMGTGGPVGISNGAVLGYKSNIPEGLKVQQAISDEPYSKALMDWTRKAGPAEELAKMEQTRNINERQTGIGALQRQQAQEKIDQTEKYQNEEQRRKNEELKVKQERADAYVKAKEFAQNHPEYKKFVDEDGNLVLYNPTDPTSEPIYPGVKQVSEMEKIDLGVEGDLKKIAARGAQTRETQSVRQSQSLANAKELEGTRQVNRLNLKTTPSGNSSIGKPLSPSATMADRVNKAIEIVNARPELKQYFVYGGNAKPTGEIQEPKGADPNDLSFVRGQLGASDVKLPAQTPQGRTLTRPSTNDLIIKGTEVGVDPLRDEAVKMLREQGKALTAANIEYIRRQLEKK